MNSKIKEIYNSACNISDNLNDILYISKTLTAAQNFCNEYDKDSYFLITTLENLENKIECLNDNLEDFTMDILKLKIELEK
ncbi:hypothetical protein HDR58_01670 [bacterium]|nr:hypothetical protein [bacterium]